MHKMLIVLTILVSGFFIPILAVHADTYEFTLVRKPPTADQIPKMKYVGNLIVNRAIEIPAYTVTVTSGASDEWETIEPESFSINGNLDKKYADKFSAYYFGNWILLPKDWKLLDGGIGANGSKRLVFVPPAGKGYFEYNNLGPSLGEAISSASLFFPEAKREAKNSGFTLYDNTTTPLKVVHMKARQNKTVMYQTIVQGQPIDGLADYDPSSDFQFHQWEISLPNGQRELATPILNWILSTTRLSERKK